VGARRRPGALRDHRAAVLALVPVLLLALVWHAVTDARAEPSGVVGEPDHPGAAALLPGFVDRGARDAEPIPPAVSAYEDWVEYEDDCTGVAGRSALQLCTYVPAPDPAAPLDPAPPPTDPPTEATAPATDPPPVSTPETVVDVAPVRPPPGDIVVLRAVLGPRAEFVEDPAALTSTNWTASSRSDRIGMRLEGGRLQRAGDAEVPSEGMVRGAVQVPPGGEPVVFLADHPVTGGYPVVATVVDADVDRAAQVRPGQGVR